MKTRKAGSGSLDQARAAASKCRDCPLWEKATQTVFGEGAAHAKLMIVGEQPGDAEDREGHPFVGPAGRLLDEALLEAGIDRASTYVTNAVKHFKWEPRGKRRLHKTPAQREVDACRQWLEREILAVRPVLILALGATAAKALLGAAFRITRDRGKLQRPQALPPVIATFHPSFVLRTRGRPEGEEVHGQFVADLKAARRFLVKESSDS
jgi:DNA polymerase